MDDIIEDKKNNNEKLKRILKNTFSLRNQDGYKIFTFLGKDFEFKNKNVMFRYKNKIYVDQLKRLLDECGDITKCKPAEGELRYLQIIRLKAMKLVAAIFEKNNIKYWLDGGTCLGAFRHKGYIPWDDDIDIVVPREDYERALNTVNNELKGTELAIMIGGRRPIRGYYSIVARLKNTTNHFTFLDIFPYDYSNNANLTKEELIKKLHEIREEVYTDNFVDEYNKNVEKMDKLPTEYLYDIVSKKYKEKEIVIPNAENCYMFRGCDSTSRCKKQTIHKINDVFPLKKVPFEDTFFYAPNDIESFLHNISEGSYGDLYSFPPVNALICHSYKEIGNLKNKMEYLEKQEFLIDNALKKYTQQ